MPMSRAVSSAWIRTPSSKLRLNRSRNATTMVSPGWTGPIRSRQPGRFMVRPLVTQTGGMEQGKKTVISVLREALH